MTEFRNRAVVNVQRCWWHIQVADARERAERCDAAMTCLFSLAPCRHCGCFIFLSICVSLSSVLHRISLEVAFLRGLQAAGSGNQPLQSLLVSEIMHSSLSPKLHMLSNKYPSDIWRYPTQVFCLDLSIQIILGSCLSHLNAIYQLLQIQRHLLLN